MESNHRPTAYEAVEITTSLTRNKSIYMVRDTRFELVRLRGGF